MELVILWVVFALIAGVIGNDRTIGFWGTFVLSLILSPLIGFIIAVCYPSRSSVAAQQRMLQLQQQQLQQKQGPTFSAADELTKITALKDSGAITEEEYQAAREKWVKQL